jgi:hypothetical protein
MTPQDPPRMFPPLYVCTDLACARRHASTIPQRLRYTGEPVAEAPGLGRWACDRCGALYNRPLPQAGEEG